jgi:hypothetical protein
LSAFCSDFNAQQGPRTVRFNSAGSERYREGGAAREMNDRRDVYVGVDLLREAVVVVSFEPGQQVGDAYELRGTVGDTPDLIRLDRDDSHEGRRAIRIALASQSRALGWTFALRDDAERREPQPASGWTRSA